MLQHLVDKLKEELPGYHFEISIYPAGGMIDAEACEECGTTKSYTSSWKYNKGKNRTIDDAANELKLKVSGG